MLSFKYYLDIKPFEMVERDEIAHLLKMLYENQKGIEHRIEKRIAKRIEQEVSEQFEINNDIIGKIIGKNGIVIEKIRKSTCARIKIYNKTYGNKRTIEINGKSTQVKNVKKRMMELIESR